MDREDLVQLDQEKMIPPLLKKNWKNRHWYDPVIAAHESLLIDRASRKVGYSAAIGGAAFFGVALLLATVTAVSEKSLVDEIVVFSVFFGGVVWGLAHVVAMELERASGLGTVRQDFYLEAFWFGKHLFDFQNAAGKSWNELMALDLKVLAEEMLVTRAGLVLFAEEGLGVGKGDFLDTDLAHRKINYVAAFKSLYSTLKELGLVSEGYKRFYTQAQKLREQEKQETARKSELAATLVSNAGFRSPSQ